MTFRINLSEYKCKVSNFQQMSRSFGPFDEIFLAQSPLTRLAVVRISPLHGHVPSVRPLLQLATGLFWVAYYRDEIYYQV